MDMLLISFHSEKYFERANANQQMIFTFQGLFTAFNSHSCHWTVSAAVNRLFVSFQLDSFSESHIHTVSIATFVYFIAVIVYLSFTQHTTVPNMCAGTPLKSCIFVCHFVSLCAAWCFYHASIDNILRPNTQKNIPTTWLNASYMECFCVCVVWRQHWEVTSNEVNWFHSIFMHDYI